MKNAVICCSLLLACSLGWAQSLTPACETQLALSALPERLRADSTVYILDSGSYVSSASGSGNFSCIVERNHPLALIPQCMDRAGTETIMPTLIFKSEKIMGGMNPEQVQEGLAAGVASGQFTSADRPGVSYMTSAFNRIHIAAKGERVPVGPHVMFYAPNLSNEDIGGSQEDAVSNIGMPFLLDSGPYGYMISFVEKPSESDAVLQACAGQLAAFGIE